MNLIDDMARTLALSQTGSDGWDTLDNTGRAQWKNHVVKLVEVLRQPDQRMIDAGAEIIRYVGRDESEFAHRNDAANTWRFMIDALLGEQR